MSAGLTQQVYLTSGSFSTAMNDNVSSSKCVCCGRFVGISTNDRDLCGSCDEDIPDHIPEEQYLAYMKELWRKK